jgi:hypothetical protein
MTPTSLSFFQQILMCNILKKTECWSINENRVTASFVNFITVVKLYF